MLLDTVAVSRKHAFQIVARAGPKLAAVGRIELPVRPTVWVVLPAPQVKGSAPAPLKLPAIVWAGGSKQYLL